MLYALHANWWKTTRPALVSMLPVPQRYYVPGRIRDSNRLRLEAADLWDVPGPEEGNEEDPFPAFRKEKKKRQNETQKLKRAFKRERVLDKARAFFSIYDKLLSNSQFFHARSERPTLLDVVFAAHTHILLNMPFADNLIKSLLVDSYPSLVAHASTVQSFAVPDVASLPRTAELNLASSLGSLLPRPLFSWTGRRKPQSDEEEKRFTAARWGWAALAVTGMIVYWSLYGLGPGIVLSFGRTDLQPDELVEDEVDEDELELLDEDEEDGEVEVDVGVDEAA